MKMNILFIVLLFFTCNITNGQINKRFSSVDKIALEIPDSLTTSVKDIASYINSMSLSDENKLRVIYIWIASNIKYDTENMYSFSFDSIDIINETLITRQGICFNYAKLFNDISNKVGVKSKIIYGYTKQNGQVAYNPHSWCVSMIDSKWYIFDPTWGSGFIQKSKFVQKIDDTHFKMSAKKAIKTHMPFDPIWQLSNFPITNQAFCNQSTSQKNRKNPFNFIDSLKVYEKQSEIDRLISKRARIANNHINSFLIYTVVQQLDNQIESYYHENTVGKYNSALYTYKEGIYLLNRFIEHRNNQFLPNNGDAELRQNLDSIQNSFQVSMNHLESIDNPKVELELSINQLIRSIKATTKEVNEHSLFLEKYMKTEKKARKSLFYD